MACSGVVEKIDSVGWGDGEVEFRVLPPNRLDYDLVAIDAGCGGIVIEGAVDAVVGFGDGLRGLLAWLGVHF